MKMSDVVVGKSQKIGNRDSRRKEKGKETVWKRGGLFETSQKKKKKALLTSRFCCNDLPLYDHQCTIYIDFLSYQCVASTQISLWMSGTSVLDWILFNSIDPPTSNETREEGRLSLSILLRDHVFVSIKLSFFLLI